MESILQDKSNVICFIDDILVSSRDEDHEKHLFETFTKLNNAAVKLNKEKCELEKKETDFLGYIISKDGIRTDPTIEAAIQNMKEPATATDLQRFLGIVNFLGRHLLNFATALNSMTELLEKEGGGPGDHHNNLRLPRSKK